MILCRRPGSDTLDGVGGRGQSDAIDADLIAYLDQRFAEVRSDIATSAAGVRNELRAEIAASAPGLKDERAAPPRPLTRATRSLPQRTIDISETTRR
jgi:hypothetical protein